VGEIWTKSGGKIWIFKNPEKFEDSGEILYESKTRANTKESRARDLNSNKLSRKLTSLNHHIALTSKMISGRE
jgi:hypothetical protein